MKMRYKIWRKLLEIIIDFVLVVTSFALAFFLRVGGFESSDFPFEPYVKLAILISPVFILLFAWGGLYSFNFKSLLEKLRIISVSCLTGAMFYVLIFFFKREIFFSRKIVLFVFLISTILILGFHVITFFIDRLRWKREIGISRVLIIGTNKAAEKIIKHFQKHLVDSFPVAVIAPYGSSTKSILNVPVVGKLDALEKVIKEYKIDEIVQCDAVEQSLNLLNFAEGNFLGFKMSPEILGAFHQNIISENIAGIHVLSLRPSPLFGWGQIAKRLFDIFVSLILLIILIPIFILVFVFRKIISFNAPVFHLEKRSRGFDNQFKIIRFYADKKTKWGRFLSDNFLRDFPEFINVLFGSMSLVGPRPLPIEERDNLPLHFRRRLILKPGIVGLWQLKKLEESIDDFEKMVELDVKYIHSWSFYGDLNILWRTVVLFVRKLI